MLNYIKTRFSYFVFRTMPVSKCKPRQPVALSKVCFFCFFFLFFVVFFFASDIWLPFYDSSKATDGTNTFIVNIFSPITQAYPFVCLCEIFLSCTPDRNCHTFCLGDKIASHPGVLTQTKKIHKTLK